MQITVLQLCSQQEHPYSPKGRKISKCTSLVDGAMEIQVEPSYPVPPRLIRDIANSVEVINNLIYLIGHDARHPDKVLHYTRMAAPTLQHLTYATQSLVVGTQNAVSIASSTWLNSHEFTIDFTDGTQEIFTSEDLMEFVVHRRQRNGREKA